MHLAKATDGAAPGLPPKNPERFTEGPHDTTRKSSSKEKLQRGLVKESGLYARLRERVLPPGEPLALSIEPGAQPRPHR